MNRPSKSVRAKAQVHLPDDLSVPAMRRIIRQLLTADDGDEDEILNQLSQKKRQPEPNDLADLVEEKRGKPRVIDPMDEEAEEDDG